MTDESSQGFTAYGVEGIVSPSVTLYECENDPRADVRKAAREAVEKVHRSIEEREVDRTDTHC